MGTPGPHAELLQVAMRAAQVATEVGTDEVLSTAVRLLRAAADPPALLYDDGSDPAIFLVPSDVEAALDDALATEARLSDALDELYVGQHHEHHHAGRIADREAV